MVILRRYGPKYIPKVLLYNLWEIIRFFTLVMLKPKPRLLLAFFQFILFFIMGISAGLIRRQSKDGLPAAE